MPPNSVINEHVTLRRDLGVVQTPQRLTSPSVGVGVQDPGLVNVSDAQSITTTIAAGKAIIIPLPGISFYFASLVATGGLNVRPITLGQSRSFINYVQGTGYRLGAGTFAQIEVSNPNLVSVSFTMFVGGGRANGYDEFIDKRVILNGQGSNILIQNGVTQAVAFKTRDGSWGDTLGAGATKSVADGYNGLARKQIIFSNNDPLLVLTVFDATGNILGTIQPLTAFTFETGGTVQLHNPGGSSVSCNIGEIYYS